MAKLTLTVKNQNGDVLKTKTADNRCALAYQGTYAEGDQLVFSTDEKNSFVMLQLDDAMGENFVYMKENELVFTIPFNEKRYSYCTKAFIGEWHVLTARVATEAEVKMNKNLAKNAYDQAADLGLYPHAHANVETRGESVFAARNAINGNICNESHGLWPYESWGINMQDDAEITVEFGRKVLVDRVVLVTRADFPHDNWWQEVTLSFSDGTKLVQKLEKSYDPHEIILPEAKTIEWVTMSDMKKDPTDPSPFPALTQIEVYGVEA